MRCDCETLRAVGPHTYRPREPWPDSSLISVHHCGAAAASPASRSTWQHQRKSHQASRICDFLSDTDTVSNLKRQAKGKRFSGKDCFIKRAKAGPIAATNPIFIHSG
eukprot:6867243-Prymnesium_polylepis.1